MSLSEDAIFKLLHICVQVGKLSALSSVANRLVEVREALGSAWRQRHIRRAADKVPGTSFGLARCSSRSDADRVVAGFASALGEGLMARSYRS